MREGLGVTFLDLWWAEFHAGKGVRAKLVGLPGSAVWLDTGLLKDVKGMGTKSATSMFHNMSVGERLLL